MIFQPVIFAPNVSTSDKLRFLADAVELKGESFNWASPDRCVASVAAELLGLSLGALSDDRISHLEKFGLSPDEAFDLYVGDGKSLDIGESFINFGSVNANECTGVTGANTAARWIRKLAEKYEA
jgi:hypothetical protein